MTTPRTDRRFDGRSRTLILRWRPKGPITRGNKAGTGYPATLFDADSLLSLVPVEVLATLRIRVAKKGDPGPEGPKHKKWNARYRKSLGKKLVKLGFKKKIIEQILKEYADATKKTLKGDRKAMVKFIAKWIWMLIKVKGAIEQEYKEEGAAPKWRD